MIFLLLLIFIMPLSVSSQTVSKLEVNDTWEYTDNQSNTYNESVTQLFAHNGQGYAVVNTDRSHRTDLNKTKTWRSNHPNITGYQVNASFSFLKSGKILLTQGGGVVVGTLKKALIDISFEYLLANGTSKIFNISTPVLNVDVVPDIGYTPDNTTLYFYSCASSTCQGIETGISTKSVVTHDIVYEWYDGDTLFRMYDQYLLTSFNGVDYTLQYQESYYEIETGDFYLQYYKKPANTWLVMLKEYEITDMGFPLQTHQLDDVDMAMEFTVDSEYKVPTYIKQVAPVDGFSGISLDQSDTYVEYYLTLDKVEKKSVSFPIVFVTALLLIPLLRRKVL
jgi:hypothetical protein